MKLYPMQMAPALKETVWGGGTLCSFYGKETSLTRLGESWELSAIPGAESRVVNGAYRGMTLNSLAETYGRVFWGERCKGERFPILVKLINAAAPLSVQVHPSDERADAALGEQGKAEMWYVLDAEPDAYLYLGFSAALERDRVLKGCEDGSILSLLNRVKVSRGDVFYIAPGTVHAIGKGITLAEIQQSSDTTFRIYDYQRLDANGQPRALHWERAAAVMDYSPLIPENCRANATVQFPAFTLQELYSCCYFRSYKLSVKTQAPLFCDSTSFRSLLCVEGSGMILHDGNAYSIAKGQSFFLPADLGNYSISGECTVLLSWV